MHRAFPIFTCYIGFEIDGGSWAMATVATVAATTILATTVARMSDEPRWWRAAEVLEAQAATWR